jgi:hypothetical protein
MVRGGQDQSGNDKAGTNYRSLIGGCRQIGAILIRQCRPYQSATISAHASLSVSLTGLEYPGLDSGSTGMERR